MTQLSLEIAAGETAASDSGEPDAGRASAGILELVRGAVDICSVPAGERGVAAWMDVLGEVTAAMTVLAAARDAAVVRLASIDEVVDEDGVVRDQVNGLGTVSLDAAAMVSIATGTSTRFGAELVEHAVTRVVRVPALHEAMLEGVLDEYKARCVADELTDVPHDLARTVVDAISGELSAKSGPALRRRTREVLFRLCPDLLKERIRKARTSVGLRRWVGEPGTDSWGGSFPSERAAVAWAAIDALARRYRKEGRYATLEQARAYALMDLVDGNTTVETVLHVTVPAAAMGGDAGCVDDDAQGAEGARSDVGDASTSTRTSADEKPGQSSQAHPSATGHRHASTKDTFVGASGPMGSELTWLPLSALSSATRSASEAARPCDRNTGALVDAVGRLVSSSYRPGVALTRLVRERDGRCRFPGCSVPARQCDLDHVIPWPGGSTTATNLICLCRRHHRIKQRRRWRVRLLHNATVEWTDPRGRIAVTEPVDHLGATHTRAVELSALELRVGRLPSSNGAGEIEADDGDDQPFGVEVTEPSDDELASMAERVMAIVLEHALAAAATGDSSARRATAREGVGVRDRVEGSRRQVRHSGTDAPHGPVAGVGVTTTEELDELGRQVRKGVFATFDEAVVARDEALRAGQERDTSGPPACRVDDRFAQRGLAPVVVDPDTELGCRRSGRDAAADAEPPPPF
jgi:hypothetical protein